MGLSPLLQTEARDTNVNVNLHHNIDTFLSTIGKTVAQLDEDKEIIAQQITQNVIPAVNNVVSGLYKDGELFAVRDPFTPEIQGFSTPEPNICKVSFSMQFQLQNIGLLGEPNAVLTVDGTCAYNTQDKGDVAEVEIESWTVREDGRRAMDWRKPNSNERMYSNLRMIDGLP